VQDSRSPLTAATLSGLIPGAGHLLSGHRRRGWWLIAVTVLGIAPAVIVVAWVVFDLGPRSALDLARPFFDHPGLLLLLVAINVMVLGFRLFAAWDAFTINGGSAGDWSPVALALAAVIGIGAIVWPQAYVAERTLALHDLFTYDYSVDPGQAAGATSTTTTTVQMTTTTLATGVSSSTSSSSTTTTVPVTTTTTTLPPLVERRVNVLLLGGDAGPDRTGIRTDSIIVASIDPISGDTAMFGIPRNMKNMPFPEGHPAYEVWDCHCWPDLINALYQYGLANPALFPGGPNPGANAVTTVIGHTLGIDIDHYVLVDLLGFVDVIDALGGLTITVTAPVYDELYTRPGGAEIPVEWDRGTYRMDGEEALSYARVRRGTDDYNRMGRQRCVLEAIAAEANPMTLLRALPELVSAVQGSVVTDIAVRDWPDFIELAADIDTDTIVSVRFIPRAPELNGTGLSYLNGYTATGHPQPNVTLIRETVVTMLTTPAEEAAASLGVDPLGEVCHSD
jgi:LCP family protein required for cell wall assembly